MNGMIDKNDITLVIQGPLNEVSLSNIGTYLNFVSKVVVSIWEDEWTEENPIYKRLYKETLSDPRIVIVRCPFSFQDAYNGQNMYLQACSSYAGVRAAETEYCIKTRSDESFGNLIPFIEGMSEHPDRLTTTNLFFGPDRIAKFHPSDHMVGGKKYSLAKTYSMIKFKCEIHGGSKLHGCNRLYNESANALSNTNAEQTFGIAYLESTGLDIDVDNSRELTFNNFWIVDINTLKPVRWTANAFNQVSTSDDFVRNGKDANNNEEI